MKKNLTRFDITWKLFQIALFFDGQNIGITFWASRFQFFSLESMPPDYPRGKKIVRPLLREQPPITPSEAAYGKRYWNPCVIKSRKVYVFLSQNFAPSKNNFTILRKTYLSCKWIYDSLCNWHRSIYTHDLQGNQEYGRSPHHENCLVDGSPSNGN